MNAHELRSDEPRFRVLLTPSRSLSPAGFLLLMAVVTVVNVVTGVIFLLLGAWPVFLFCGLDVALIYVAFRVSYRSGRLSELIEIGRSRISLMRTHPSGLRELFELNPYWARVRLQEHPSGATELWLASHGKELAFGSFLGHDERREVAALLNEQLQDIRSGTVPR